MGVADGVVIDSLVLLAVVAGGWAAGLRRQLLLLLLVMVVVVVLVVRGRRRRWMSLIVLGVGRVLTTRHHRRRTGPMGSGMCRFLLTEVRAVLAAGRVLRLLLLAAAAALVGPGRRQGPRGAAGAAAPVRVAASATAPGRRVLVPLHAHGLVQSAKLRVCESAAAAVSDLARKGARGPPVHAEQIDFPHKKIECQPASQPVRQPVERERLE
jgi:hypothetical protein